MRKYEILLILPAEADDAVVTGVTDRITGVIGPSGGEVSKVDRWGRRRFSYEIDHATEGYYLLAEFVADPDQVRELDRVLALADEVIRFKVVVVPERKTRGRTARAEPSQEDVPATPPTESVEAPPVAEASPEPQAEAPEIPQPEPEESQAEEPASAQEVPATASVPAGEDT